MTRKSRLGTSKKPVEVVELSATEAQAVNGGISGHPVFGVIIKPTPHPVFGVPINPNPGHHKHHKKPHPPVFGLPMPTHP